jgi:hypothetical protein
VGIAENIRDLKAKIGKATLLAATKEVPPRLVIEALAAGITDIGENRVQEAQTKIPNLKTQFPNVKFHMIGHLQTNKVKTALELFDVIQSVDSLHLAREISKRTTKPMEIFIEVNTSGEASKYGIQPEAALEMVRQISKLPNLQISGLMTLGPLTADPDQSRKAFRKLRELRDLIAQAGFPLVKLLSMGMSDDFPLAIEEGSDIIRIGRAIFKGG